MKAAGQMGENERVARESSFAVPSCEGEEEGVYSEVGYVIICFCQHDYLKIKDKFYMFTIYISLLFLTLS